jgi:hypothetical protein
MEYYQSQENELFDTPHSRLTPVPTGQSWNRPSDADINGLVRALYHGILCRENSGKLIVGRG